MTKGSNNYVCLEKLNEVYKELSQDIVEELSKWVQTTRFGDLGEIQDKVDPEVLEKIRATECYSRKCPQKQSCPYNKHKQIRKNLTNGILICNHNMLAADINMRLIENSGLWPAPAAIIIDEAHGFENACRVTQGTSFSFGDFNYIKQLIFSSQIGKNLYQYINFMNSAVKGLFKIVARVSKNAVIDENDRFSIDINDKLINSCRKLLKNLKALSEELEILSSFSQDRFGGTGRIKGAEKLDRAHKKLQEHIRALNIFIDSPNKYYASGERQGNKLTLFLEPIEVDQFLSEALWHKHSSTPIILTSGTLAVDGSFTLVKQRLGLTFSKRLKEFIGAQQLDLAGKIGLYIGEDLPEPKHDSFIKMLAERIHQLIQMAGGRTLVLFTSHQRMNYVYGYLNNKKLPFPVYKQNEYAHGILIEKFRREVNSVLLATGSFWEGIDVVGQSLSLLILDKLPFPSPNEPLTKIRRKRLEEQGLKSFDLLELPEMLLRLRQGSGRLIRHEKDTGIIAILDSRTKRRSYTPQIFKALPLAPELTLHEVQEFFIKLFDQNITAY